MDGNGCVRMALDLPNCTPDGGLGQASGLDQTGHFTSGELGVVDLHTDMVTNPVTKSMDQRLVSSIGYRKSNQMNPNWPQQETFCNRVKEFAKEKGLVTPRGSLMLEPLAALFDVSPPTLKQFLQNKLRPRPHYDTLSHIAGVIGSRVTEFMDDPGEAPPGVPLDKWADASERDRVINSAMFSDITADDLSEEEKDELYRAWKETVERVRRLKGMRSDGSK